MSRIALVTGAGRGIGLELCRLLLDQGDTVVACPRRPGSEGLASLRREQPGRLFEIPMDVGDDASVTAAGVQIRRHVQSIDLLINNAGVYPEGDRIDELDAEALVRGVSVNAIGPLRVVAELLPLLRAGGGKRLVQVTSLMGSIGDNTSGGSYGYRMSKAALNMAVRNLALELGDEGFVALALHPGWVRTRMGGEHAPLELHEAAIEVLRLALETGPELNGAMIGPGGRRLPW